MFGTMENINRIQQNENWLVDGTFKVAPVLFYQVFTIHAMIYNKAVPFTAHLPRTNNSVEAWHRAFEQSVGCNHPSIFKLMDHFRFITLLFRFYNYNFFYLLIALLCRALLCRVFLRSFVGNLLRSFVGALLSCALLTGHQEKDIMPEKNCLIKINKI